jgi:hypothetical protein
MLIYFLMMFIGVMAAEIPLIILLFGHREYVLTQGTPAGAADGWFGPMSCCASLPVVLGSAVVLGFWYYDVKRR